MSFRPDFSAVPTHLTILPITPVCNAIYFIFLSSSALDAIFPLSWVSTAVRKDVGALAVMLSILPLAVVRCAFGEFVETKTTFEAILVIANVNISIIKPESSFTLFSALWIKLAIP